MNALTFLGLLVAILALAGLGVVYNVTLFGAPRSGAASPASKRNCPARGARNEGSRDRCRYCDEPLTEAE